MDESPEILLRKLCCTCLSKDRKLVQLTKIKDGVNNLYSLLSIDSEAYQECFYREIMSLFVCWECNAFIRRLKLFRQRACSAQRLLTDILDGKIDFQKQKSLSSLRVNANLNIISERYPEECEEFINEEHCISELNLDNMPLKDLKGYLRRKKCGGSNKPSIRNLDEKCKNQPYDNQRPKSTCNFSACMMESKREVNSEGSSNNGVQYNETPSNSRSAKTSKRKLIRTKKDAIKKSNFQCKFCEMSFETKRLRVGHSRRVHAEGLACSVCGKRYPSKYSLLQHERLHRGPLPREECGVCHKMIRVDLVKVHARIHEDRQSYECLKCDKKYVSKASYENHLKFSRAHAVVDVLKYKCSVCEKGYRSKGELRDHVNYQHLGQSQHSCPICQKPLATRRCITRHIRRAHQNIKENLRDKMCQKCGKAFRYKKSLREHELIHTGEKPLVCGECGRRFRQGAALYTHCRRVHQNTHDRARPTA